MLSLENDVVLFSRFIGWLELKLDVSSFLIRLVTELLNVLSRFRLQFLFFIFATLQATPFVILMTTVLKVLLPFLFYPAYLLLAFS